jgi:hypothetical protein
MACAEAARATPEFEHVVLHVGSGLPGVDAATPALVIPAPLREPRLAWRGLRRSVSWLGAERVIVQPWSDGCYAACRAARVRPLAPPVALSPSLAGEPDETRAGARSRLGIDEETPVVALLAEPSFHADARRFVYMIGLLDVAGIAVAGLVGSGTAHLARARRFHREAAVTWRLLLAEEPAVSLVHACDLVALVPPAPLRAMSPCEREWVRWSVLRCHLLGVPVVGASEWLDEGLCPPEARGYLDAAGASITDIGRKLARLVLDGGTRKRVGEAVRAHVSVGASRGDFARALRWRWSVGEGGL